MINEKKLFGYKFFFCFKKEKNLIKIEKKQQKSFDKYNKK